MLEIRPEHLTALAAQQSDGFAVRMRLHLREVFSVEVAPLDDEKLSALVERVCAQAEEWGIIRESLVERLIELFVSFEELSGKPFPQWIVEIMKPSGRSAARKFLMLETRLLFRESVMREFDEGTFNQRVSEAFCAAGMNKDGASTAVDLPNSDVTSPERIISSRDCRYRRKWNEIAARLRKSRAIPKKRMGFACGPLMPETFGTNFQPVRLSSKGGTFIVAQIARTRFQSDRRQRNTSGASRHPLTVPLPTNR